MRMSDKQIRNNQRYNAERKAQAELMKRDLDRDRMLSQIYQESFDRMQREIDGFYMRYANREGLTKQEAMKRVSEMDVTKFNAKAAKAVKEKDFSHATNEWLKVYNLKMKVSRLELLKAELTLEIQNLTAEVNEVFDKARTDEYLNEYKRQAGILGISSSGAKKRMQAILDADFYGQKFSSRVWGGLGLRATLQREVFGSLNRIFTDMMGYKQEMKRLAKKYGTSEQNAKRLLKTEIARINADTQYSMLKDNGFTHMIFVAEPGACNLCGPLDKVAVPIEDVEKGVNMYPMHPNCRCSAYGHIKMEYKAGGSTLDREAPNGVWGEDDKAEAKKAGQKQISGQRQKQIPHDSKNYRSVKDEWLNNVDPTKAKLTDRNFWEHGGKKYEIDGHNVVLDYNQKEKETAQWLSELLGRHVEMVPRVNFPKNIPTPDYLVDGVKFDLKEISGSGKNVIDNASKKAKEQAENIVFDITNTPLSEEEIFGLLDKVYKSGRRGLNTALIKKSDKLVDIIKPKEK
ncbi:minor capsid protein [Streptococcus suis]|nr:minor capsid protein [Streptococcus suis]NQO23069.1 minor capsid protein [Streptococcus suis]